MFSFKKLQYIEVIIGAFSIMFALEGDKPLPGPIFCLLLGTVSSEYAQPITGQVTEVTCPVIGRAQPELTPSKRQKSGPELILGQFTYAYMHHQCSLG